MSKLQLFPLKNAKKSTKKYGAVPGYQIKFDGLPYQGKSTMYVHFCMNSMHETDLCGKATVNFLLSKYMSL